MKRFLWYFLLFLGLSTILLLSKMDFTKQEVLTKKIEQEEKVQKFAGEKRAVFFSYIELSRYILDKSEEEAKQNIITVLENMNDNYLNMLLLQVRSFSDAIYFQVVGWWFIKKGMLFRLISYRSLLVKLIKEILKSMLGLTLIVLEIV